MFQSQNLTVYNRSLKLSIELCRVAVKFPYRFKRLQDQLIGAVTSITLNIAEGSGRFAPKEKCHFYRIAQASAYELIAILEICEGLELLKKDDWFVEIEEICKLLSGLIKSKKLTP